MERRQNYSYIELTPENREEPRWVTLDKSLYLSELLFSFLQGILPENMMLHPRERGLWEWQKGVRQRASGQCYL